METDMGDPSTPPRPMHEPSSNFGSFHPEEEEHGPVNWMPQPPPQQPIMMMAPPPEPQKKDIFAEIDKTTYIIAFAVFILGFFMGKTMQPVILRQM